MVKRTKKNVPLYEKFGLFTEAPKRKKRVINIRAPRSKDFTTLVDPDDDIMMTNISPDEDPFSGEVGELDFTDTDTGTDVSGRDLEGELDDELRSLADIDSGNADSRQLGGDAQIQTGDTNPEGADSTAVGNTSNSAGTGADAQSGQDGFPSTTAVPGSEQDPAGAGNVPAEGTGDVPTEPANVDTPSTAQDTTGGYDTIGNAGGDQSVQAPTEPTGVAGDTPDAGTTGTAGEDPTDPDGAGDVDETIEVDTPTDEEDFTAGIDTGEEIPTDATGNATNTDANPVATDPTSTPTPNDPNADPTSADVGMNADMEAFDKNDMRKYQLFKRFIDLHDVSVRFTSTLDAIISDDADYGAIISNVTKKLKRVEGILKDYMILKFQSDSYLQNSFFFEKAKTTILLALEMLKRGKN